jgi:hypothetical protein
MATVPVGWKAALSVWEELTAPFYSAPRTSISMRSNIQNRHPRVYENFRNGFLI